MSNIHLFFPTIFPVAASFPLLDAFTTVMSFVAQMLMAHKRIENWMIWIVVDVIGIGLYFTKGVIFVSGLYVIFLVLATRGLLVWLKEYREARGDVTATAAVPVLEAA
jgi:nicotinamide mononucleotide transporter